MKPVFCIRLLTILLGLALAGCSSGGGPKLDSTPAAKYGRIVVAAIRMPASVQRAVEERLRAEIAGRGVNAITLGSLNLGTEPRTPKILVQKILQAGAQAVFVLDPFVFERDGEPVVKSVILTGLNGFDDKETIASPPVTYKAALYDVDNIYRVWMDDVNSVEQRGKTYPALATEAAREAVAKAVKAGVL